MSDPETPPTDVPPPGPGLDPHAAQAHWERVYQTKAVDAVSWYTPHLATSLELIGEAGLSPSASMLDVGAGASTLAADLLDQGFTDLTVVDLSATALERAREARRAAQLARGVDRPDPVRDLVGDIRTVALPAGAFDLWHDRAVFHFLTAPEDQAAYLRQAHHALRPGGRIIVATFGPDGPEMCSGLPVVRYSDEALQACFGSAFERVRCVRETHATPWGTAQAFVACLCRRRADASNAAKAGRS